MSHEHNSMHGESLERIGKYTLPYNQQIWRLIKFGDLAIAIGIAKIKICQRQFLQAIVTHARHVDSPPN